MAFLVSGPVVGCTECGSRDEGLRLTGVLNTGSTSGGTVPLGVIGLLLGCASFGVADELLRSCQVAKKGCNQPTTVLTVLPQYTKPLARLGVHFGRH